ncbi:hypothetical protein Asi03nite_57500 [Actinoplanes siamensis]|uniref:Uncharacterized protein n=1 Tax=Actinoplanes siamensis TaxID=1223317 RepID=A0A919TMZ9_9ACTN|nr:hypothetical protein Asi03nite_57500 [Actinoplanes siamensis]
MVDAGRDRGRQPHRRGALNLRRRYGRIRQVDALIAENAAPDAPRADGSAGAMAAGDEPARAAALAELITAREITRRRVSRAHPGADNDDHDGNAAPRFVRYGPRSVAVADPKGPG